MKGLRPNSALLTLTEAATWLALGECLTSAELIELYGDNEDNLPEEYRQKLKEAGQESGA